MTISKGVGVSTQSCSRRVPKRSTRIALALILTFFPYLVLYGVPYPGSELLIVATWIWAFPSRIGVASLALLPLVIHPFWGYYAFNLFCIIANCSIAYVIVRGDPLSYTEIESAYRTVCRCMAFTAVVCLLQVVSDPAVWMSAIPGIILPGGRGAGFRSEPSLLAGPLMLYLGIAYLRLRIARINGEARRVQSGIIRTAVFLTVTLLLAAASVSVLVVVLVMLPIAMLRKRRIISSLVFGGSAAFVGIAAFGDRIRAAFQIGGGSFLEAITVGMASWRSIPDIIVLLHFRSYLWPGSPGNIRPKLNDFAFALSPAFYWLESTYSAFAASATTIGLVATAAVMLLGLFAGLKHLRHTPRLGLAWVAIYIAVWFILPKYDACGWIVLGLLPLAITYREQAQLTVILPNHRQNLALGRASCSTSDGVSLA